MSDTKLYEIINPSDPYTLAAERFEVAAVATLMLGKGRWGLDGDGDGERMPIFLFGGHEKWRAEHGIDDLLAWIDQHEVEIATVLESVLIGNANERRSIEAALSAVSDPTQRESARKAWHDERRSSLNDIGRRAWAIAEVLRKRAASRAQTGGAA